LKFKEISKLNNKVYQRVCHGLDQCCPNHSPHATCGEWPFKCGEWLCFKSSQKFHVLGRAMSKLTFYLINTLKKSKWREKFLNKLDIVSLIWHLKCYFSHVLKMWGTNVGHRWFRLRKQDDYFESLLNSFEAIVILRGNRVYSKKWLLT